GTAQRAAKELDGADVNEQELDGADVNEQEVTAEYKSEITAEYKSVSVERPQQNRQGNRNRAGRGRGARKGGDRRQSQGEVAME
ncbi:hypothetical protein KIPB_012829, partial [Kipferlia bialata]